MRFKKREICWSTEAYEAKGSRPGERIVYAYAEMRISTQSKLVVRTDGIAGYFDDPNAPYGPDSMVEEGEEQIEQLWDDLKNAGMT